MIKRHYVDETHHSAVVPTSHAAATTPHSDLNPWIVNTLGAIMSRLDDIENNKKLPPAPVVVTLPHDTGAGKHPVAAPSKTEPLAASSSTTTTTGGAGATSYVFHFHNHNSA
jgi:hypothetical protein